MAQVDVYFVAFLDVARPRGQVCAALPAARAAALRGLGAEHYASDGRTRCLPRDQGRGALTVGSSASSLTRAAQQQQHMERKAESACTEYLHEHRRCLSSFLASKELSLSSLSVFGVSSFFNVITNQ